jgi:hydrogenase nickel incorporation protein HypB
MRLARSQAPVKQITTGTLCHLEAAMVQNALEGWDLNDLDFLFIENVGNLVCPSSYDENGFGARGSVRLALGIR